MKTRNQRQTKVYNEKESILYKKLEPKIERLQLDKWVEKRNNCAWKIESKGARNGASKKVYLNKIKSWFDRFLLKLHKNVLKCWLFIRSALLVCKQTFCCKISWRLKFKWIVHFFVFNKLFQRIKTKTLKIDLQHFN